MLARYREWLFLSRLTGETASQRRKGEAGKGLLLLDNKDCDIHCGPLLVDNFISLSPQCDQRIRVWLVVIHSFLAVAVCRRLSARQKFSGGKELLPSLSKRKFPRKKEHASLSPLSQTGLYPQAGLTVTNACKYSCICIYHFHCVDLIVVL